MLGYAVLWLATQCFGQTVYPKHIETPVYPPLAQVARIQGTVILKVTIDADGEVYNAEVANDAAHPVHDLLARSAFDNILLWRFEKPPTAPFTQLIVYQFKFDRSPHYDNTLTEVKFDLPDHVTILAKDAVAQPAQSKKGKQ